MNLLYCSLNYCTEGFWECKQLTNVAAISRALWSYSENRIGISKASSFSGNPEGLSF